MVGSRGRRMISAARALEVEKVKEARGAEMGYFRRLRVYDKVGRSLARGYKLIRTKWIDTSKGDFENPNIRCRLVGKNIRTGPDDTLFASTPPLEAFRFIVS